jgi:predicted phage-related endonuclease
MADPQPRTIALAVDQQREESMLGASEAGAVFGLDKYKSPMAVWRRHRGLPVNDDGNEAAEWGVLLEPVVRGKYALSRQRRIYVPTASYTLDGWLRATPDGLVEEPPCFASQVGVLEFDPNGDGHAPWVRKFIATGLSGGLSVKTCSAYLAEDWIGGPPARHEVQCRVEMAVVDLPWVDILCLVGGQKLVGPFRIERDAAIEHSILTRLRDFWAMVQDGREPTVDDSDAWRLHVSEKLGKAPPLEVVATEAQREIVARWRAARTARKAAERGEESVKNELLLNLSQTGATKLDAGELGKPTAYRTKSGTWALRTPSFWKEDSE